MTGLMEIGIISAVGIIGYGAHKTGTLRKLHAGIIGKIDAVADKIKDPIIEMKLKQAKFVEYSTKIADKIKEVGGAIGGLEETQTLLGNEVEQLRAKYKKNLAAARTEFGEDIPAANAQPLIFQKQLIELKQKTHENIARQLTELNKQSAALRLELATVNAQLEMTAQLIESARLDRSILKIRSEEISALLSGALNIDRLVADINIETARIEGELKAAATIKEDLQKNTGGPVSIASLEI